MNQQSKKIVPPTSATRSSEVSTPRAFGVDNDEVVGSGVRSIDDIG